MNYQEIITEVRTYLKQWFLASKPPKLFMSKELYGEEEMLRNELVYKLGEVVYETLTKETYEGDLKNPKIIRPRLYQFLSNVLHENPNQRIVEPEILLQLLTPQKRDTIEINLENEKYELNAYSTIGVTRNKNEDFLTAFELPNGVLVLMVADGMGGGEAGEIASRITVSHLTHYLNSIEINSETIEEHLRTALFEAHQKILTYAQKHAFKSMGTTLSLSLIFPNGELFIAHIGDSRIYEMEYQGELRQLSEDHSYPEVLFRLGKIREEEKKDYQKNIVVYILGKENLKKEEICIYKSYLYSETDLLLCSDGYWDMIPVDKSTFTKPFETLKEEIFQQVSKDNVSLIRYQPKKNTIDITDKVSENE